jgi:putative ABC transport system permease protein
VLTFVAHTVRDVQYAARGLLRTPGVVVVLVVCLSVGIGVNTTLFALFNSAMLQGATAREPGRLVQIEPGNGDQISFLNYRDLRGTPGFAGLAISAGATLNLRRGDRLEQLSGLQVSGNFFEILGADAAIGRTFNAEEGNPAHRQQVLVLDHHVWAERFDSDPQILGRMVNINGQPFTVVGVLQRAFRPGMGLYRPDAYVPISAVVSTGLEDRHTGRFDLRGRLLPDVTRQQAAAAFTAAAARLEEIHPTENAGLGRQAAVFPLTGWGSLQGRGVPSEVPLLIAAPFALFGLILLIACANVAGVLLARAADRRHELAVRVALGASRADVVRMLLTESLFLSSLATAGGLLATIAVLSLLGQVELPNAVVIPLPPAQFDSKLVAYTFAMALGTCLLCGLLPALQTTRLTLSAGLREGSPGSPRRRLRSLIVAGQVAASVLLLATAVMFLKSLLHAATVDPGFDVHHGITARLTLESNRFTDSRRHLLAEQLADRLAGIPGVTVASYASLIPLGGNAVGRRAELRDRPEWRGMRVSVANVGPRFFDALGIPLRAGRDFHASDRAGAPLVAIVNEAFVRQSGINGTVSGRFIRVLSRADEPWREIVGLVADTKYASLSESPEPQVFLPFLQTGGELYVQVRTAADPAKTISAVREAIAGVDSSLLADVRTTRQATSLEFTLRRAATWLLGALGAIALLLAMIGLFGVLAWDVSRRTAEIGIRMALGASRSAVRNTVVADGLKLVGLGTAIGYGLMLLATVPMRGFLIGVTPSDPVTMAGVAGALAAVAAAASWVPAHRASSINPTVALRRE